MVAEEPGLLADRQQGLLGLYAGLGGLGPGDQDTVAFTAEVGAPGARLYHGLGVRATDEPSKDISLEISLRALSEGRKGFASP